MQTPYISLLCTSAIATSRSCLNEWLFIYLLSYEVLAKFPFTYNSLFPCPKRNTSSAIGTSCSRFEYSALFLYTLPNSPRHSPKSSNSTPSLQLFSYHAPYRLFQNNWVLVYYYSSLVCLPPQIFCHVIVYRFLKLLCSTSESTALHSHPNLYLSEPPRSLKTDHVLNSSC